MELPAWTHPCNTTESRDGKIFVSQSPIRVVPCSTEYSVHARKGKPGGTGSCTQLVLTSRASLIAVSIASFHSVCKSTKRGRHARMNNSSNITPNNRRIKLQHWGFKAHVCFAEDVTKQLLSRTKSRLPHVWKQIWWCHTRAHIPQQGSRQRYVRN